MTSTCAKVRFGSRRDAGAARTRFRRRTGRRLRAYRCQLCGFWHLTSADWADTVWFRTR